jgi:hypothetical protein
MPDRPRSVRHAQNFARAKNCQAAPRRTQHESSLTYEVAIPVDSGVTLPALKEWGALAPFTLEVATTVGRLVDTLGRAARRTFARDHRRAHAEERADLQN